MKKYLAAGAVGVVAFAFAASAAQLNVDAGVLQAGVDDDLTCSENADVTFDHHASNGNFWVTAVNVAFDDDECIGEIAYLAITDVGGIARPINAQTMKFEVTAGEQFYGNYGIPTDKINDVNLTVYSSNPSNPGADSFDSGAFDS